MTLLRKSDGPKYVWDIRSFLFENNTFISCADKKRTKEAADGSAPRNPLRRSHFQDANGIEVSETQRLCDVIRPQRLSASFVCCNFNWLWCLSALQMVFGENFWITKRFSRRTTKKMRYYVACRAWGLAPMQITAAGVGWRVWLWNLKFPSTREPLSARSL